METLIILFVIITIVSSLNQNKKGKTAAKPGVHAQQKEKPKASTNANQLSMDQLYQMLRSSDQAEGSSAPVFPREGISKEADFRGSMNARTSEGDCLCDPSLEHERNHFEDAGSVYATEISDAPTLDLSAQGIWQGVVMSEVLARPAQRFRR